MRSVDSKFYKRKAWETTAAAYRKHCGGLCERCKAQGIYKPAQIVHHKKHLNPENIGDPAIAYGFDNLEALCLDCHNLEHIGKKAERRRYEFGKDGEILI